MKYAKIVLGLPIDGPFDYSIPATLEDKIEVGSRALVPFRNKKMVGYIVATSTRTTIKKTKPIYRILDSTPILDSKMLKITKEVSEYCCCSWGEAIEAAIPVEWRKNKEASFSKPISRSGLENERPSIRLIQDLSGSRRWVVYNQLIERALNHGYGVIFLSPEIDSAVEARDLIKDKFTQEVALLHSRQSGKDHLYEWCRVKSEQARIIVGTRQAVFAPVKNLGLIILDNENDHSFKQDQSPHYDAREVAFIRSKIDHADLVLASVSPRLESIYKARKNKINYQLIDGDSLPEVKTINMKQETYSKVKRSVFSFPFQDMLKQALERKAKTLVFLNRKGFATYVHCRKCHAVLRCPNCNVNLIYHFKEKNLVCHYCNYNIVPPEFCPDCKTNYIRYSGIGIEKVESELSRLFPAAKISCFDKRPESSLDQMDIVISTSLILKQKIKDIDNIGVVSLDSSLNRVDFRAAEETFSLLLNLISLRPKKILIQTNLIDHYCFQAVVDKDIDSFYRRELDFRKQLNLPPFSRIALVKLRGKDKDRVRKSAEALFEKLKNKNKDKAIDVVSCFACTPAKLRGNYHWQVLLKSKSTQKISRFLKKTLREFRSSGIIVTVDIDPI